MNSTQLKYKIATEPWEFEQVHALNYRTFTEEIPQHETNQERKRIDRFDRKCIYYRPGWGYGRCNDRHPLSQAFFT